MTLPPRRAVLFVVLALASSPPTPARQDGAAPAGAAGLPLATTVPPADVEPPGVPAPVAQAGHAVRVRDGQGQPVPGARLGLWAGDERLVSAETDAQGIARYDVPRRAPDRLTVVAPGFVRFVRALDAAVAQGVPPDISLDRGATVVLTATDRRTGRAVTSCRALVVPMDEVLAAPEREAELADALAWQTIASGDGTGRIGGLPARPVLLVVQAEGYRTEVREGITARGGAIAVRFDDEGCRSLRLADAETGAPVSGAVAGPVLAALEGPLAHFGAFATSDGGGRMTYCPLPGQAPDAFVVHGAYAPRRIELAGAQDGGPQEVLLEAGGAIEGSVHDVDGRPVAALPLSVTDALGRTTVTATDAAGRFRLERLPAGAARVACTMDGTGPVRRALTLAAGRTVAVELGPGPRARVEVVDEDGRPLRETEIVLLAGPRSAGEAAGEDAASPWRTDAEGGFTAPEAELASGALVAVNAGDRLAVVRIAPPVDGSEGAWRAALEGREIRGTVRAGVRGPGLAGALVTCVRGGVLERAPGRGPGRGPARGPLWIERVAASFRADAPLTLAASGADGRFTLRVPPWCGRITVEGPAVPGDGRPWAVRRVVPADDLEIALERGARIVVTVEPAPGTAAPAPPFVELRRPGAPGAAQSAIAADGRAVLDPPDDGPWLVVARIAGLAPAVSGPLTVGPEGLARIVLSPGPGAFVEIGAGVPLVDGRGLDWSVLAPRAGERLGPLPPGTYHARLDGGERKVTLREAGSVVRAR